MKMTPLTPLALLIVALWPLAGARAFDWDAARQNLGTVEVKDTKLTPIGEENPKGPWVKIPSVLAQSKASTFTPTNEAHNESEYHVTKGGWIFFAAFLGGQGGGGEWKKDRKDEKQLQAEGWIPISAEEVGGIFVGRTNYEFKLFAKLLPDGAGGSFHVNKYTAPYFLSFADLRPAAYANVPKSAPAAPPPPVAATAAKTTPPAPQQPAAPGANLLKNGSFENGMDGWNFENHQKKATVAIDTNETHEGHPSVRIDNGEAVDSFLVQTVTLKPSTRYRLSGYIKGYNIVKPEGQRAGEAGASLAIVGGYTQSETVADATKWTHVVLEFTTAKNTELKLGPRLGFYGKQVTGTGWYADLSLVELNASTSTTTPATPAPSSIPPVASAKPASPASSGPTLNAADVVKANRSNLVFVTTSDGAGSGFIAHYGTGTFLITNAHVAAGAKGAMFKTLDGTQVQIGSPAVAVGHDIFMMSLKAGGTPFEVMVGVDQEASIGDRVVVLGNAEGAGVINTIEGKIVGLGPNLVEVDAAFQPGNSGSPIIHLKTGKVIGVATYLTIRKFDSATKQAVKDPIIRRFGYRLDSIKSWQAVNWQAFYAQATEMEAIEKLTDDLVAFLRELGKEGRVMRGASMNPAIKNRVDQWADAKSKHLSPRDAAMADQSLLSFLKLTCQADINTAQQHLTYDYFQRALADQQRDRKELADVFAKIIDDLRK